jgi:HD-GYP domain-containing protein (c-di-GMP phosphodiesterase class II)
MSATIKSFESISTLLSQEQDLDRMLNGVVSHLKKITSSEMAVIYLYDAEQELLVQATEGEHWGSETIACPKEKQSDIVDICQKQFAELGDSFVCVPLSDRRMSITGVLILKLNTDKEPISPAFLEFVTKVSGSAATAVETRKQVEAQSALIDAIIRLLADAIDAKSPYTGGHCERVPMLAEMLIDQAQQEMNGVFAGFMMDETQRREFKIAAWLHDCGKITSREYVIDKATKLETIYNRIHEIRTRFEVVWRDLDIEYWQGMANGQPTEQLEQKRQQQQLKLQEDFALIARLNIGGEALQEADIARLNEISDITWLRHFSRNIGISKSEAQRLPTEEESLPVREHLIADRPEHLIPWGDRKPPVEKDNPDNHWGFDMSLPEHEINQGELHNLAIIRGTLTEEERFLINEHIVQTIRMLSTLPFPEGMKKVPDIAGNHHEKMDGSGYPRKLTGEQLSIPEKIMALADVFEALTAKDRPYKDAKTLSQSLKILAVMVREQHIDADVFRLFIESGVYQNYAEGYLADQQKDAVNIEELYALAEIAV